MKEVITRMETLQEPGCLPVHSNSATEAQKQQMSQICKRESSLSASTHSPGHLDYRLLAQLLCMSLVFLNIFLLIGYCSSEICWGNREKATPVAYVLKIRKLSKVRFYLKNLSPGQSSEAWLPHNNQPAPLLLHFTFDTTGDAPFNKNFSGEDAGEVRHHGPSLRSHDAGTVVSGPARTRQYLHRSTTSQAGNHTCQVTSH